MGLAKTALAIGIAVVFAVFIAYGLFAIYEPPKYYEEGRSNCTECYTMFDECRFDKINESVEEPTPIEMKYDRCHEDITSSLEYKQCMASSDECEKAFEVTTASYKHSQNSFWILFFIALAAIIGGIFISGLESIGSGLIGGGVLVLLWSLAYTARYWIYWNKFAKLFALFVVLVILIYLGYKKIEKKKRK